jgi:F420-non-reducing hydrogenase large subunit
MSRRITIDPITRLEGHGRIEVLLDEQGNAQSAFLQIPELRGFERFCVGRAAEEMPVLTNRICGVCPEAHHMAAAKAADAVYGVEPPPAGKKLRELLYSAFYFADTRRTSTSSADPTSSWGRMRRWPSATSSGSSTRSASRLGRR